MSDGRIPQDVLDGIQAEIDQQKAGQMMGQPEDDQEPQDAADPEVDAEEAQPDDDGGEQLPDGYKTLEEYVADGGDPDYYRGPKAYEKDRELIGEIKDIKRKLSERDDEMVALQELHEKERQRLLKDIEKKKAQAKEDLDFEAYDDLSAQERELQVPKPQAQQGEPPVIRDYRQSNPKLNPASPHFDKVYNTAFENAFNTMATDAEKRAGRPLNESEVQEYLDATARLFGAQQQAQRRKSPAVEPPRRAKVQKDPVGQLPPEYRRMYDRWMAKGNKEQAANLLKQYQANAGA